MPNLTEMTDEEIRQAIKEIAPLADFPDKILQMKKFTDPTSTQVQKIAEYNQAIMENRLGDAENILINNDLEECRLSSENLNKIVDEVKSIEEYYKDKMESEFAKVSDLIIDLTQRAMAINDNEVSLVSGYSSYKIEQKFAEHNAVYHIELPLANWRDADGQAIQRDSQGKVTSPAPYTQKVANEKVTNDMYPLWYYDGTPDADEYESFGYVSSMETYREPASTTGYFIFTCASDMPTVDLKIMVKGL